MGLFAHGRWVALAVSPHFADVSPKDAEDEMSKASAAQNSPVSSSKASWCA